VYRRARANLGVEALATTMDRWASTLKKD
jgi:hypothetical protein